MFKLILVYKDGCPQTPHMMGAVVNYWDIDCGRLCYTYADREEDSDFEYLKALYAIRVDGEIIWQSQV